MGSSITAATADLYDRLANATGLDGVQVTFGPPTAHEEQEVVAILGVLDAAQDPGALGAQRREETYDIEIGVKVHDPTADPDNAKVVFDRSRVLVDAIENEVHGSTQGRTLGGTVRNAQVRALRTDGILPADPTGWVIFWRVLVTCAVRVDV